MGHPVIEGRLEYLGRANREYSASAASYQGLEVGGSLYHERFMWNLVCLYSMVSSSFGIIGRVVYSSIKGMSENFIEGENLNTRV